MTSYFVRQISEKTFCNILSIKNPSSLADLRDMGYKRWNSNGKCLLLFSRAIVNNQTSVCMYVEHFGHIDFKEWICEETFFIRGI